MFPQQLPEFPWDRLVPFRKLAATHPDGLIDLSIGTPVDDTPAELAAALTAAANSPGYPPTEGTSALRAAIAEWFQRQRNVALSPAAVIPTVGSKEMVALLPGFLGIGPGDAVVVPRIAYPTYAVGAHLVGAEVIAADDVSVWEHNPRVKLVWLNSPANPTGRVLSTAELAQQVQAARRLGAIVASDECYAELGWEGPVPSLLQAEVSGGNHSGLLVLYSLSKQSNLAGYRAGILAGDAQLVREILQIRKHLGLMVPGPVQAAMQVALTDIAHVRRQKEIYRDRRRHLWEAFSAAGFRITFGEAGLYLWATADTDCWGTVEQLARAGVLVAPGEFYGPDGVQHVRISFTAPAEKIHAVAARLREQR